MNPREPDSQIAARVMTLIAARKSPRRIAAETGLPKILIARVTRLLARPDALSDVLEGRKTITAAFRCAFPDAASTESIDKTEVKGVVDRHPPEPRDNLAKLVKRKLITEAEAEAGRVLRAAARGWSYPGLEPSRELLAAWPAPLRALWDALRPADAETARRRLPTASVSAWNLCVDDAVPGCLTRFHRPPEAAAELEVIRIGLFALAARIAAGLPEAEQKPKKSKIDLSPLLPQFAEAIDLTKAGLGPTETEQKTGLSKDHVRRIRQVYHHSPDLLPLLSAGQLKIHQAARLALNRRTEGVAA
jgi:hypothetical protein